MFVEFEGRVSRANKKLLQEAACFFAHQLMDPRMVRDIRLDICVSKKHTTMGECIDEDNTRSPRYFTINLRNRPEDCSLIRTLAHEMVHVKQHAKNQLRCGPQVFSRGKYIPTSKWNGSVWRPRSKECDYFDSPWEIEAYGLEESLCHKWDTRNDKTKPWYIGK
jgi:hypothetical protein